LIAGQANLPTSPIGLSRAIGQRHSERDNRDETTRNSQPNSHISCAYGLCAGNGCLANKPLDYMFRATLEAGLTGCVFVEVWELNAAEQRYMRGVPQGD